MKKTSINFMTCVYFALLLDSCSLHENSSPNEDKKPYNTKILEKKLDGQIQDQSWSYLKAGFTSEKDAAGNNILVVSVFSDDKDVCQTSQNRSSIPKVFVVLPDLPGEASFPTATVTFSWFESGEWKNILADEVRVFLNRRDEASISLGLVATQGRNHVNGQIEAINCRPTSTPPTTVPPSPPTTVPPSPTISEVLRDLVPTKKDSVILHGTIEVNINGNITKTYAFLDITIVNNPYGKEKWEKRKYTFAVFPTGMGNDYTVDDYTVSFGIDDSSAKIGCYYLNYEGGSFLTVGTVTKDSIQIHSPKVPESGGSLVERCDRTVDKPEVEFRVDLVGNQLRVRKNHDGISRANPSETYPSSRIDAIFTLMERK